jgi:DNA-binding transcriptional LysR family regulator
MDAPTRPKPQIDLQHLRVFEAVFRLSSLTKAAETLGLSQSALSKSLQALRAHFADPLFVRTGRGMEPTPRAEALSGAVQQALRVFDDELRAPAQFDPAVSDRYFALMCSDFGALHFLPDLLAHTSRHAPRVRFGMTSLRNVDMAAALSAGEADLVVGAYPDLGAGIFQQALYKDGYACLVSTSHPRIGESLSLQQFLAERQVIVSAQGTGHTHREAERRVLEAGGPERIAARVHGFTAAPFAVRSSELICTMPRRAAESFVDLGGLKVLPCPLELPTLEIMQYWHERYHHDPGNRWLRGLVFELFGGGARSA